MIAEDIADTFLPPWLSSDSQATFATLQMVLSSRTRSRTRSPFPSAPRLFLFTVLSLYTLAHTVCGQSAPVKYGEYGIEHSQEKHDTEETVGMVAHDSLFSTFSKALFGKRDATSLTNNIPGISNISGGTVQTYVFPSAQLFGPLSTDTPAIPASIGQVPTEDEDAGHFELKPRQGPRTMYLTLSICTQPSPSTENVNSPPPELNLYISSPGHTDPGPFSNDPGAKNVSTVQGFTYFTDTYSEDVNFAVYAPPSTGYTGTYSYEVTASVDQLYTQYMDWTSLYLIDRDNEAGLFTTTNLTNSTVRDNEAISQWTAQSPRFSIFIFEQNNTQLAGLKQSYCGLKSNAPIQGNVPGTNSSVEVEINTFGGISARQQFYVPNLKASSKYTAVLGLPSNYSGTGSGTPTGGGAVWQSIDFTTNTDDSCQVIYNLEFCSSVSYAVPSNGSVSAQELAAQYDNYTQSLYQNFNYSLQQIPCDTEPESQYSLATNCSACDAAYRAWICAVTIPRCADGAINETFKMFRGFNQSRSPMINNVIKPEPYNEILPCGDICFPLVQNCPASLQFMCPYAQTPWYDASYGYLGGNASDPTCNIPGAVWGVSTAKSLRPPMLVVLFIFGILAGALQILT